MLGIGAVLWALVLRAGSPAPRRGRRRGWTEPITGADYVIAGAFAVTFYVFALWRLATPPVQIFDEVYHARTAMDYVAGRDPHEWTHPPLSKLIAAVSLNVWGARFESGDGAYADGAHYPARTVIAWRFASVVWGAGTLAVLYALARSLFGSRAVATVSTALLALDGAFWVQSRVAMTNIFTVFFVLLATLAVWKYAQTDEARQSEAPDNADDDAMNKRARTGWLLLSGAAIGCAIATRWSSLYAWAALIAFLLLHRFATRRWSGAPLWTVPLAGALLILPAAIYLLSYIPYALQGPGTLAEKLFTPDHNAHGWGKVIRQQFEMWDYHAHLQATHGYNSPWWSWPLMLRPVWYYFEGADGVIRGVWCVGNGPLWWASAPALFLGAFIAVRERRAGLGLASLMGLSLWLLWGVKSRPLNFMHYYFDTIPFACIALGYFLVRIWDYMPRHLALADEDSAAVTAPSLAEPGRGNLLYLAPAPPRSLTPRRALVAAFGANVVGWFISYYPLLSAYPISDKWFQKLLWLGRTWI